MAPDIQDWTQAVTVTGGTVNIGGTASVSIVGTPTVAISGTPTVNIAGTPTVTISGGSVNIANASIAVINATGTKITSSRPPVLLTVVGDSNIGTTNTVPVPADIQALVIAFPGDPAFIAHAKISWQPVSGVTPTWVPLETYRVGQQVYVVPVLPGARALGIGESTTLSAFLLVTPGHYGEMEIWGLFESNPLWLEFFAPPFAEPNQPPIYNPLSLAAGVAKWLIAPVANVRITVFHFTLSYFTNAAAGDQWYVAHAAALPGAGVFPAASAVLASGGTSGVWPFNYPLGGSELPRGDGIYAELTLSGAANLGSVIVYSLD